MPLYELARDPVTARPFYVMRLVNGKTLSEVIVRDHENCREGKGDRVAFHRLLEAFMDVCRAVGHAHSKQVIHRDLKPSNILVGDAEEVVVLDWGLAKDLSEPGDANGVTGFESEQTSAETPPAVDALETTGTGAGTRMGTLPYMSPEQAAGEVHRMDARTDIFGLGAILFEILTGRAPRERIRQSIHGSIQVGPPPLARAVKPSVPCPLEAVCAMAMAQEPVARYASALDLARDIQRWLADEPVSCRPEPFLSRLGRWSRRHRTLVASALATIGAAAILVCGSSVLLNAAWRSAERSRRALCSEAAARAQAAFK